MARNTRVTIREIARMCGVSMQTVSRVINHRPDVAPATRMAVEAAIASVGFQPSAVARSLVQRRSQTIGVVAAGLKFFGVAQTLNGITDESQAADYAVLLKEVEGSDDPGVVPSIDFLTAHRVDGIIFAAPELGSDVATLHARLPQTGVPIVFLKFEPSTPFVSISIDNRGGARSATEHLLALGRRRIGHIAGPRSWREARDRHEGWLAALRDADVDPGPVVAGNWSSASGEAAFQELLSLAPDLDAVFAGNDQMALGLLHAAHKRRIAIPDEIAVVGFDGLAEAAQFTPALTTVLQPLRELGQLAVRELLATIDSGDGHNQPGRGVTLSTQLVVRESAPAAPSASTELHRPVARA